MFPDRAYKAYILKYGQNPVENVLHQRSHTSPNEAPKHETLSEGFSLFLLSNISHSLNRSIDKEKLLYGSIDKIIISWLRR